MSSHRRFRLLHNLARRASSSSSLGCLPIYTHSDYTLALPVKHTFPMERYCGVETALLAAARRVGDWEKIKLCKPPLATRAEVELAHCPEYVRRFAEGELTAKEIRTIGFPFSDALVQRTWRITGATIEATRDVLAGGYSHAANLAGGTHHAFRDSGEGFCIINDIAVAARVAQHEYGIQKIVVVDLDVHQGNGTASMLREDPDVYTFSLHGEANYPWKSRVLGDLDIGLEDDVTAEEYLAAVSSGLATIDDVFLKSDDEQPPLVFYQAGVDPLAEDRLGRLSLTHADLRARNALVYEWAAKHAAKVVVTMGGGYSRPIDPSVTAHVDVFLQAAGAAKPRES